MASSPEFVEHALELTGLLGPVEARAMFGGHGLYHRGVMFALLDDDELFLKTDAENLPRFLEAGCEPWIYVGRRGPERTSYYRPPADALEHPEAMLPWARTAVEAALRKRRARPARPAAAAGKGGRSGPRRRRP